MSPTCAAAASCCARSGLFGDQLRTRFNLLLLLLHVSSASKHLHQPCKRQARQQQRMQRGEYPWRLMSRWVRDH